MAMALNFIVLTKGLCNMIINLYLYRSPPKIYERWDKRDKAKSWVVGKMAEQFWEERKKGKKTSGRCGKPTP